MWREKEGGNVKMKAKMEAMCLQTEGCHRLPTNYQKLRERPRTGSLRTADTLVLDFWSAELGDSTSRGVA